MADRRNEMLIGCAVVFKEVRGGKLKFLLNQNEDGGWEILKAVARKGESSVRAAIRYTTEQGTMSAKVIEEANKATGTTTINGKSMLQKYLYYAMAFRGGGEMIGFEKVKWLDYAAAIRRLKLKREQDALRETNKIAKNWYKTGKTLRENAS